MIRVIGPTIVLLFLATIGPPTRAQVEHHPAKPADTSHPEPLPETLRGRWRLDRNATLALYDELNPAEREVLASGMEYWGRFDLVLRAHEHDAMPSTLGEPMPLRVLEADDASATIILDNPDGPMTASLRITSADRLRLDSDDASIRLILDRVNAAGAIERKLPEPFRATWRIDRAATLALYENHPEDRRARIATSLDALTRFDIVLTATTYDSVPSILGEPIPITVLEAADTRARIAIESPDMGRIDYTLERLADDRITLSNPGENQIDIVCTRVDTAEIIQGNPVEFLSGAWEIDMDRLRTMSAGLPDARRRQVLDALRDFRLEVSRDSFAEIRDYAIQKIAPNRYDVTAQGRTSFHVTVESPDTITLVSSREYPLRRASSKDGGPGPDHGVR